MVIKKKKGFTLAEALVILGIIGVIAALTMPSLIVSNQKQQYYSSFAKIYSSLSMALDSAIAKHGGLTRWGITSNSTSNKTIITDNILPELQIMETCTTASECGVNSSLKIGALNSSSQSMNYASTFWDGESIVVVLKDGTFLKLYLNSSPYIGVGIDTNGITEPNVLGRDVFLLEYVKETGASDYILQDLNGAKKLSDLEGSDSSVNCTTSKTSVGWGCGNRLLIDRDMKY